jgi:hypothetical protein
VGDDGGPRFCADAAADPATGLHAATAALAALFGGGSHLIDIALAGVARLVAGSGMPPSPSASTCAVAPPSARVPRGAGPTLGRDTARVLAELVGK